MVRLCIIAPTPHLEEFATLSNDVHLVLSHLINISEAEKEGSYTNFYRTRAEQGDTLILDNGLFENHVAEDTVSLCEKASAIKAKVIVAPDVLYDSKATIKSYDAFRSKVVYKVMAVPQADNPVDWLDCYKQLVHICEAEIIGLSILSIPKSFGPLLRTNSISACRRYVIRLLEAEDLVRDNIWHHCLGLGDDVSELSLMNSTGWIYSNDSSSAVVHGAKEIVYDPDGTIPGGKIREKLDFNKTIEESQHKHIYHNIAMLQNFASKECQY